MLPCIPYEASIPNAIPATHNSTNLTTCAALMASLLSVGGELVDRRGATVTVVRIPAVVDGAVVVVDVSKAPSQPTPLHFSVVFCVA